MSHPALKLNFMLAATLHLAARAERRDVLNSCNSSREIAQAIKKVEMETVLFRMLFLMKNLIHVA
jgi:hypothetical protein